MEKEKTQISLTLAENDGNYFFILFGYLELRDGYTAAQGPK